MMKTLKKAQRFDLKMERESKAYLLSVNTICWKPLLTQPTFTCSKSTTETIEKGMKYVQSYQ